MQQSEGPDASAVGPRSNSAPSAADLAGDESARFRADGDNIIINDLKLQYVDDPLPENLTREDGALLVRKKATFLEAQDRFFRSQRFEAKTIFELGIWRGGSTAFWFEYFHPEKLVAVDIADREHEPEFLAYLRRGDRSKRIKTYWRTSQSDGERLLAIYADEFDKPLDLVIDDASHEFSPTWASFEILYPRLRSGGIYLIEDWIWETQACFREPDHPWAKKEGLVQYVKDFVSEVAGARVHQLTVLPWFAAIEKP